MKILNIGPLPPEAGGNNPGGVAHHVWSLNKALTADGHTVHLLPIGRYFALKNRVKSKVFCFSTFLYPWHLPYAFVIAMRLFRAWMKGATAKDLLHFLNVSLRFASVSNQLSTYDVIHVHGMHNSALLALRAIKLQIPMIVTMHSYHDVILRNYGKKKRIDALNKRLECADGIIHVSNVDRQRAQELGVNLSIYEYVVHNGVLEPEYPFAPWTDRNGFCFIGGLLKRKRIGLLLSALKECGTPSPLLVVAGEGNQKQLIKNEKRFVKNVCWVGLVDNARVREIMRKSNVLVVPSSSESFGIVYIEALMEGAAVIGYAPVIEEFHKILHVDDDERRLLVPFSGECEDPVTLAILMINTAALRSSKEGDQIMNTLRKRVMKIFGWKGVAKKMTSVYKEIIKETR